MWNAVTKAQIAVTLNLLSQRHQKILNKFTANKFVPDSPQDIMEVCQAMNALEVYNQAKAVFKTEIEGE